MDDNSQIYKNFEHVLKNNANRTPISVYSEKKCETSRLFNNKSSFSAQDVILNVNKQIQAIQKADSILPNNKTKKELDIFKKSSFLSVNMLPRAPEATYRKPNRFETQCVSDTQLIDIIDNAEAIAESNNGITQEFDSTFCEMDDKEENCENKNNNNSFSIDQRVTDFDINTEKPLNSLPKHKNDAEESDFSKDIRDDCKNLEIIGTNTQINICNKFTHNFNENTNTQDTDNAIEVQNKHQRTDIQIDTMNVHTNNKTIDEVITPSPVFQVQKSKSQSPLVFDLGSFENFEKLALPIIEESPDLTAAKQLINSQIIGKELLLGINMKSKTNTNNENMSPILKVNTEKLKITKTPDPNIDLKSLSNKNEIATQLSKSENTFLEDEILFSSDEEDEYIHKELQDIPLTCALETSFYEQPDVLDKTMFVGFQTASNRSIQITTDSFTKAKTLLDEIERDVASSTNLTELVNSLSSKHKIEFQENNKDIEHNSKPNGIGLNCEDNYSTNKENNSVSDNTTTECKIMLSNSNNSIEKEKESQRRPEKRKFDGFMMASKKKIKLSDMALARCRRVFQDIDLEEKFIDSNHNNKETSEVNNDLVNSHIDDDLLHEFSRDMSLVEKETNETVEFIGFKTANNKNIQISKEALAKTKSLFDDIDVMEDFNKPTTSKSREYVKYNTKNNDGNEGAMAFIGFKAANNKEVKISKQPLLKTKNIFKDLDQEINGQTDDDNKTNKTKNKLSAVQPIDDKELNEELCQDLNTVFEDEMLNILVGHKQSCGFQTASHKPIKISEKALLNSKKVFADIELDNKLENEFIGPSPVVLKRSQTVLNVTIKDCFEKLGKNKSFNTIPDLQKKGIIGTTFKTANNCPINVSKKALEKSTKLFEGIEIVDENNDDDKEITPFRGFEMTTKKLDDATDEYLGKRKLLLEEMDRQNKEDKAVSGATHFKGFRTGNNKPITITLEALAKSKALLKDIENEDNILLDNIQNCESNAHEDINFKGFQTANITPVGISTEAIKSNVLFDGLDDELKQAGKNYNNTLFIKPSEPAFGGFKTANNRFISVSDEALLKTKTVFKDIDNISSSPNKNNEDFDTINSVDAQKMFKGFQTASNKRINVTSEALARSKLLFKDIGSEEEIKSIDDSNRNGSPNNFKGFQTANRKPVSVSAQALAKSKALFKDIDEETAFNDIKYGNERSDRASEFAGFKTATEKPISISAQALAKSKAVFKEIENYDILNENINKFERFQTSSSKTVSEEAVLKTKTLYEDVNSFKENVKESVPSQFKGFQTASNKNVKVSEQALKRTRQIFQDIELSHKSKENNNINECRVEKTNTSTNIQLRRSNTTNILPKKLHENNNLEKLIDTQVINDFEQTLNTEDFCKNTTPKHSKRSGSPILSCPRAKKRKKFETPYKNDGKPLSVIESKAITNKPDNKNIFTSDYKKNKTLKLKDLSKIEINSKKIIIDPYILDFNLESFLNFEFVGKRNDVSKGTLTIENLKEFFQKSVNNKLLPIGWMENHLKLIIWKLISYEIKFPSTLAGVCKARNVLDQLKYRFDRELYNAERPALRKIMEKDDVPSKTMVLCVAGIFVDGANVKSVTNMSLNVELLLTDGWYFIKSCIDRMLTKLVYDEKITVGCKIVTTGAELLNCEQGVSPWEDTTAVRLKISGNSTRRARWDARLGYHGDAAILSRLSSVKPEGGRVSRLRLFVARVYPMLYVEKFEDGSTVTRSERLEHIHQAKYETQRQVAMEKLYEEVEKELSDQESQDSHNSQIVPRHRRSLSDSRVTESQAKSLEARTNRKRERILQDIQERVRKKIEEKGLSGGRNVVTLMKVRVAGLDLVDGSMTVTKGLMSIWKPNDLLTEIIKEGTWIEVMNVLPTAVRYSEIYLSAGRQSIFSHSRIQEDDATKPYTQSLKRICHSIKDLAQNPTLTTDYNEIDTVGLICQIDEVSNQPFQNVYLTDSEKNLICVNFWGGLKKFGFENILEVGQIVYGTNLQRRAGNTRKSVPHFRVTEFSYFTKTPKNAAARNLIENLEKNISCFNRKKFCEECAVLKNSFPIKCVTENVSPYRFNNDHNLTKNKVFIDSPLAAKCEDNLNLTGLDFESTFKQTDTEQMSPKMLQRKRIVKQKIARLKMIGEPPPLSPLHIINKSKSALNSFRSPLAQTGVANMKQSYQSRRKEKDIQSSPIIQCDMNKSYQRNIKIVPDNLQSSSPIQTYVDRAKNACTKNSEDIQSSPLLQTSVTSIKKCYQNSRITNDSVQSSPVISMNRTYVKNVNPVRLNFSNAQDNSLDDVDQFAEEFDCSPPLSLD